MSMPPLFPKLAPKLVDPLWFNVDRPCDDEEEISELEAQHLAWIDSIAEIDCDALPVGQSYFEFVLVELVEMEEQEELEADEDNGSDVEQSEGSQEEEDEEMDVSEEGNSPFNELIVDAFD